MPEAPKAIEVLRAAWLLAGDCRGPVAATIAFVALSATLVDRVGAPGWTQPADGLLILACLYLQWIVTARALSVMGLLPDGDGRPPTLGRFVSALALWLFYWIGILFGLALLVLPGLALAVRWSLSLPALIAEERPASASLERSWALTAQSWPLAAIVLLISVALSVGATLARDAFPGDGSVPAAAALAANLLAAFAMVANWLMVAALYGFVRRVEQMKSPTGSERVSFG